MSAKSEPRQDNAGAERQVVLGRHLHARPAGQVAQTAARHQATTIELVTADRRVNARSVLAIMGLGAVKGDQLQITVSGPDADPVADEVAEILQATDNAE